MIWLLFACAPISLEFSAENNGCVNHDFDNPEESELIMTEEENDLVIQRPIVYQSASAEFVPQYSIDRYKVFIREYWEGEGSSDFCWNPTVRILNHPDVNLEFWWYVGDEPISVDVLQYEAQ